MDRGSHGPARRFLSMRRLFSMEVRMARTKRGKRDGTGPYKDSWQRKNSGKGRREANGEKCPKK